MQVVVTDYETKTSGKGGGVDGLLRNKVSLVGGIKAGSSSGRVGLNIRLIDPDTGISLGGSMTSIGEIEVTQVQEKFSIARSVSLSGIPDRGEPVKATTVAAPLEFADKWKKPK